MTPFYQYLAAMSAFLVASLALSEPSWGAFAALIFGAPFGIKAYSHINDKE